MKPPSYHELRVPILKKKVAYTNELLMITRNQRNLGGNIVVLLCLMGGLVEPIGP